MERVRAGTRNGHFNIYIIHMKKYTEFCLFKNNKKEDKHPDYTLMIKEDNAWVKVGAAWKRQTSKVDAQGNPTFFLSGKMDERENASIVVDKKEVEEEKDVLEDAF
jgi:uncharacterized protein (DUF736 family)